MTINRQLVERLQVLGAAAADVHNAPADGLTVGTAIVIGARLTSIFRNVEHIQRVCGLLPDLPRVTRKSKTTGVWTDDND